jgi:hypothetical protein
MSYIAALIVFASGIAMIVLGKARNGVPRSFLRSYPVGIAYTMATMALLVFGVALMFAAAG